MNWSHPEVPSHSCRYQVCVPIYNISNLVSFPPRKEPGWHQLLLFALFAENVQSSFINEEPEKLGPPEKRYSLRPRLRYAPAVRLHHVHGEVAPRAARERVRAGVDLAEVLHWPRGPLPEEDAEILPRRAVRQAAGRDDGLQRGRRQPHAPRAVDLLGCK